MNILGFEIEGLLLLQFLVTALVICGFAVSTSLQEARSERLGTIQMLLLVDFLTKHHPHLKNVLQLTGFPDPLPTDASADLSQFSRQAEEYRRSGELPPQASFRASTVAQHFLHLLLAPLTGIVFPGGYAIVSEKFDLYRIVHTKSREDVLSKFIYVLAGNLFYLAAVLIFLGPTSHPWITGITVWIAVAATTTCLGMLKVVRSQVAWKDFWQDGLLDIIARAGKLDHHDLYNRALLLKGQIEAQPNVPLPGGFGFYVGIYSFVQAALLIFARMMEKFL